MKKLFTLLAVALAIVVMVAGCGSNSNSGNADKKGGTIGLSISTLNLSRKG